MGVCLSCCASVDPRLHQPVHHRVIELIELHYGHGRVCEFRSFGHVLLSAPGKLLPGLRRFNRFFDAHAGPRGGAAEPAVALSELAASGLVDWDARPDDMVEVCTAAGLDLRKDPPLDRHAALLLLLLGKLEEMHVPGGGPPAGGGFLADPSLDDAMSFGVQAFFFFDFGCHGFLTKRDLFM